MGLPRRARALQALAGGRRGLAVACVLAILLPAGHATAASSDSRGVLRRIGTVLTSTSLVVTEPPPGYPNPAGRPAESTGTESAAPPAPVATPTPRPTPAPKPTPRQVPYVRRFIPPLSPSDARALIMDCYSDVLLFNDPATSAARCTKAMEIIAAVDRYLTVLDQRHSTLDSYKWYFIDREKVGPGIDNDPFVAKPPIPNVSAISFAVDYGDVYMYTVSVIDTDDNATTFPIHRMIEESYPHEEICYLFFPTTVKQVDVKYGVRRRRSRDPRLTVFAGVAREEEYLKQVRWYLRYANRELQLAIRNARDSRAHIERANDYLRKGTRRLILYRMKDQY
jgi:hypothetical protein